MGTNARPGDSGTLLLGAHGRRSEWKRGSWCHLGTSSRSRRQGSGRLLLGLAENRSRLEGHLRHLAALSVAAVKSPRRPRWADGRSRSERILAALAVASLGFSGACSRSEGPTALSRAPEDVCGGFEDWRRSTYVLPYPSGRSFVVGQGNCSGRGHSAFWKYGYDFLMPIGTLITAARGGIVVHAADSARDGDRTRTNLVTVEHDDGTVLLYSHLTYKGALVAVGDRVVQGQAIARSGNTGLSTEPHLHLSLHPCASLPGLPGGDSTSCPTLPLNFRNTSPNPQGLSTGVTYLAGPL